MLVSSLMDKLVLENHTLSSATAKIRALYQEHAKKFSEELTKEKKIPQIELDTRLNCQ